MRPFHKEIQTVNTPLLLIDDNQVFLQTLARSLSRRGESVLTASCGDEALAHLEDSSPSRAVLDLNLAGDSGLQLLSEMLQRQPQLQVVMLTGYSSIATAVEAIKRGALNYLCKPVTATELLAAFGEPREEAPVESEVDTDATLSVRRLEWEHIQRVLQENEGNISATARALNMHRRTLQRKLQKKPARR
ncbi:response regulator transcription factor [Hahella sp. KA22]|uniref:response regulator transcription factor n=1 Tax=Hahella sp. KA22 TaxID=1628392 RepID=UPI0013E3EF5F|nr:response regulator [Hahella sp. KA22]